MPKDPIVNVKGMIGLCAKAGRVSSGVEACVASVRKGSARLVLIDGNTSAVSRKTVSDACAYRGVVCRELPADVLASAIGKPGRMAAAITHDGFASSILTLLDQQRDCGGVCRE